MNKAGTANEILRDVLGLKSTSAVWVETTVQNILDRYKDAPVSQELLEALRTELNQLGLSKYLPDAIDELDA